MTGLHQVTPGPATVQPAQVPLFNVSSQQVRPVEESAPSALVEPPRQQLYQVEVPQGMNPGDTFQAHVGGRMTNIHVPKGSAGGCLIQIYGPARYTS